MFVTPTLVVDEIWPFTVISVRITLEALNLILRPQYAIFSRCFHTKE